MSKRNNLIFGVLQTILALGMFATFPFYWQRYTAPDVIFTNIAFPALALLGGLRFLANYFEPNERSERSWRMGPILRLSQIVLYLPLAIWAAYVLLSSITSNGSSSRMFYAFSILALSLLAGVSEFVLYIKAKKHKRENQMAAD